MAVRHYLFHHLLDGHFLTFVGMEIPCIPIVAVQAAHQAALQEQDVPQARAVHRAARFDGVYDAFALIMAVAHVFCGRMRFGIDGVGLHNVRGLGFQTAFKLKRPSEKRFRRYGSGLQK